MMAVSALVMKPGKTPSGFTPANAYRRAVALIIANTLDELRGRKFGKIVHDSSPRDTALNAVNKDLVLMPQN
jgi:hypothetical protein